MSGQTLSTPNTICILRLSAIGDVCHAVAMVQQIQHHLPDAKITWIIGKVEATLLGDLPGVEFIVFDKNKGLEGFRQLRQQLKGREFDVLLHMQIAFRSSLVNLCIKAKTKIGFDKSRAKEGQWLFCNAQIEKQTHPHVLEGFQAFAKAIGVEVKAPTWEMPLEDKHEQWALNELGEAAPFAIIAPAASKVERNWSAINYAKLADYLSELGFSIVLCGGPSQTERTLSDEIKSEAANTVIDMVGKTSLKQLLAIIKHAHLVVAPDTGPAHMAVTMNTPVVGLYAHSNPRRTGPYLFQKYIVNVYDVLVEEQHGKPWQELPWGVRVKGVDLMERISFDSVKQKVDALVQDYYPNMGK